MKPNLTDRTMPEGRWEFDEDVTDVFDNMLARSIPQYETMRELVLTLATSLASIDQAPIVLDLGCSRGESISELYGALSADASYVGIDSSKPMVEAARSRFENNDSVAIELADLRDGYPNVRATVTIAVLTLQFVPLEHRQRVVHDIFTHTRPGERSSWSRRCLARLRWLTERWSALTRR